MSPVKSPEEFRAREVGKNDKIVVSKEETDELPPGWTKVVKSRKNGSATKFDRFYTDPVTGYIFRSLKDVQRYLKTGKLGRLAIKPKTNEKEKTIEISGNKRAPEGNPEPPSRASKRLAGGNDDAPPLSPPEPKTRQTKPETGTEISTSPLSKPEPKTRQAKRLAASPQPKTRHATRQAGIKIESPPPSPPDTRTSRQPTRTRPINPTTPKKSTNKTEPENPTNMIHNEENSIITPPLNQENTKNPIETNLEKPKSPVINPTITNPVPQPEPDSSINFSMNDLWTDPCIEFAVKTLTGAIPLTDLNKAENFTPAPSQPPLQSIWTDPCIEFAVKTLTGAIPVTEDDYLLHRPVNSVNPVGPHNFSSPMNMYQTGYNNKQQESVFPTFGNGGLQKSGKFVSGGSGQCSRSRFYQ